MSDRKSKFEKEIEDLGYSGPGAKKNFFADNWDRSIKSLSSMLGVTSATVRKHQKEVVDKLKEEKSKSVGIDI